LALRKGEHRRDYKRYLNGNYCFITSFNIIKFDDCYIELIENYPCNSKEELERREGELIREMDCVNKVVVGRTKKEYREENKEVIAEKRKEYREANKEKIKEYYEENKEKIKEYQKEYYEENKEKIKEYRKEYREENKEVIAEKGREYREANKEVIAEKKKKYHEANKEKLKEKYTCECGSVLRKNEKSRHERTKKHQAYMK
jgi:hypothetical protein